MKKVLTILVSILLIALIIFCVHSCVNKADPVIPEQNAPNPAENQPVFDNPNTEEDESESSKEQDNKPSQIFTEIGIFNGKSDYYSIEVIIGSDMPFLMVYRLSPEVAKDFSSYNLEIGSPITFEYQEVDGQTVITKIIQ